MISPRHILHRLGAAAAPLVLGICLAAAQQVDTAWVATFSSPDSLTDYPVAIAVDPAGDIIVAGSVWMSNARSNIAVLKYSSDGNLQWWHHYDGPPHGDDEPTDIVVDRYGYIYVAGSSRGVMGLDMSNDAVFLKYFPSGDTVWTRRFEGADASYEEVNGLAVDAQRNVLGAVRRIESSTLLMNELITVKYYPDGLHAWTRVLDVQRWTECLGIGVDASGTVVLGGWIWQGAGNPDYEYFAAARYGPEGDFLGLSSYRDTLSDNGSPEDFILDPWGNIVGVGLIDKISGETVFATTKFDAMGNFLWEREYTLEGYDSPEVVAGLADKDGNVYCLAMAWCDSTDDDMVVSKYHSNGDSAWVVGISIPGYEEPVAMAVDDGLGLYLLGRLALETGDRGWTVVKLDSLGTIVWVRTWGIPGRNCEPYDIAVDQNRNVIVAADADFGVNASSIVVVKFQQSGASWIGSRHSDTYERMFTLEETYPNPFNGSTTIGYNLTKRAKVELTVFDVLGRVVSRLVAGESDAGAHRIVWDASGLPSGLYICRMAVEGSSQVRKLLLLQ